MSQSQSQTVYVPHTILRYYPLDGSPHYTAIVVNEKGQLLEVKRGAVKEKREFEDVDSWLESLPNEPTADDLLVNEKHESELDNESESNHGADEEKEEKKVKEKKEKKVKEKKEKEVKEKKLKLNLIPLSSRNYSTYWTIHIHHIIKEANPALLKQKEVIEAFNGLVDVLVENRLHVQGLMPATPSKYSQGINLDENPVNQPLKGMCYIRLNSVTYSDRLGRHVIQHSHYDAPRMNEKRENEKNREKEIETLIVEAYRKLFVLIRSDVLPYMERKAAEIKMKERAKNLERLVNRMERVEEVYEKELERRLQAIESFKASHQREMNLLRQMIGNIGS